MYDGILILRLPMMLGAGVIAGWLGARNELRLARPDGKAGRGGLLLRVRTLQFALSLYLILSTVSFCASGLYASQYGSHLILTRTVANGIFSSAIQTLATGALTACISALHFVRMFSEKHGIDLW